MNNILLASLLIVLNAVSPAAAMQEQAEPVEPGFKLSELASLPVGLTVTNPPEPVFSTPNHISLSGVEWIHATTVSAAVGPVKIVEFGYFVERNGQWEWPYEVEVPFSYGAGDFADKFGCPGSELKPGESYTFSGNRSVMDCVPEQTARWYFIGVDAQGHRVKGEAEVKLLAEGAPDVQGPR